MYTTTEELFEKVFSLQSMPKLSQEGQQEQDSQEFLSCETEKYGSWVPQAPKPRMTIMERANSYLPDRQTDKTVTCESGVSTHSQWLAMSMEIKKPPLLEVATKQQLVKTQQTKKT
jgi:hypothetical protein